MANATVTLKNTNGSAGDHESGFQGPASRWYATYQFTLEAPTPEITINLKLEYLGNKNTYGYTIN
jgi:hypothetical protein